MGSGRTPIAVIRGGWSGEAVISHQSAERMLAAVDSGRYDPYFVTITPQGWRCERADGGSMPFDRASFGLDRGRGIERFAFALIAIHGAPGEDGRLQGLLDLLGVPYQTGGVLNMALTFSKYSTTALLRQLGFRVAPSVLLHRSDGDAQQRVDALGYPCFVKPDRSGSSLGVSKVKGADGLATALDKAFAEGDFAMAEAAVSGRELSCGVIGLHGGVRALPVCEVRHQREFFDYQAKYHDAATQELIPAPLPPEVTALVQERSVAVFRALDCRGMVRVDHFWTGSELVTIEVNTVPGFSAASILPKALEAAGIPVAEAINGLIAEGLRHR